MRKLKLDTLQVESFHTSSATPGFRGTVDAHADEPAPAPCRNTSVQPWTNHVQCAVPTYDARECGETQYFDCTFGCSLNTHCAQYCWVEPASPGCEVK